MKINWIMGIILAFMMSWNEANAVEYKLAVQPILPKNEVEEQYKMLAEYLSEQTGETITIKAFSSFKSYFANMKRKKGFDIVLDAAHFTNYRAEKMGYKVIAKLPDSVSFSLVTRSDLMVFDAEELVPFKVATMASPAIGGLRLKELYPNPDHSPAVVRAFDSKDALQQVMDGRADAAMVPTPLLNQYPELNTVLTTDPIPHMAFSVAPEIPGMVVEKIKKALINAVETEDGRNMLSSLKVGGIDTAANELYAGYGNILQLTKRNKPVLTRTAK